MLAAPAPALTPTPTLALTSVLVLTLTLTRVLVLVLNLVPGLPQTRLLLLFHRGRVQVRLLSASRRSHPRRASGR